MQVKMYDLRLFIFKLQNVRFSLKYIHLMILFQSCQFTWNSLLLIMKRVLDAGYRIL